MGIFESSERFPVDYLPTGDKALLIAWAVTQLDGTNVVGAILCLEDGRAVLAAHDEFRFDYRYSNADQTWYDVSKIVEVPEHEEEFDADADQEDADDGGEAVPGHVPDPHGADPGDPVDQP